MTICRLIAVCARRRRGSSQSRRRRPIARKPPRSAPPPALKLPPIQKRQLSNGLPVWIVELHEVPVVAGQPGRLERQRRRPGGQVRRREPDGGDADGGRRLAVVARDRRRDRLPRRRSRHGQRVDSSAVRLHVAGRASRRRAADHGRRRAAADVPARGARPPAAGAADHAAPGARRPEHDRRARLRARRSTGRRIATARPRWARRRRSALHGRTICARSTPRRSDPTTPRSSSSATSRPTRCCRCSSASFGGWKPRPAPDRRT